MSRRARWLVWIGVSAALLISLAEFVAYQFNATMQSWIDIESAKGTTATIVSVTEMEFGNQSRADRTGKLFKICFTIDSFDQVRSDWRQEYQSAETRRLAKGGPRCIMTNKAAIANSLKTGDKLTADYLQENEYHIDIAKITAAGEELLGDHSEGREL
jgi:hypothetical protein